MSGMKISLDAAMRARDVSPSDWRDDGQENSAEPDNSVAADDLGATEDEASQPAESEAASSRSDDRPRRRRRRLRRGRPT